MKKITALALAALLALCAFAGCSLKPESEDGGASQPASIDRDAAIITVGDQVVTMGEYMDLFDTYASYYVNYGYDIYSDPAALKDFQSFVLDTLTEDKVITYQAQKSGVQELSPEKLAEIDAQVTEELEFLMGTYRPQAEQEAQADSTVDVEARTRELLEAETEFYTGSAMSYDAFVEWIRNFYTEGAINELFRQETLKGLTVSDEAIQAWYDENLEEQTKLYTENGGSYKDDQENAEKYGGAPVLFAPEGYSRVLHILISPEEMPSEEYMSKMDEMDVLAAEYGELAFEAAVEETENPRLAEIVTAYKALDKEAQAMDAERLAPSVATATEVYKKLEAGGDFATLMAEYTQDNSILSFDTIAQKGLLISNQYESEVDWSKEAKTAFAALQQGQYSQAVQDDEGVHIIYYLSDETPGAVPLDTVKEQVMAVLLEEMQEQEWASMLETWKNDGSVKIDEELAASYIGSQG